MKRHRIEEFEGIKRFVLAGDAIFTLVSQRSGERFTYRVTRAPVRDGEDEAQAAGRPWFVKVLTGPENTSCYQFVGCIWVGGNGRPKYTHGRRSRITRQAKSVVAFEWFIGRIAGGVLPTVVEFWHEGRCGRCGRTLTVPESIAYGIGPVCAEAA
jgi:hypothetical protein